LFRHWKVGPGSRSPVETRPLFLWGHGRPRCADGIHRLCADLLSETVYPAPPLPPLVHLHGALFTAWIILLLVQTSLVALKRTDLHRRLGVIGAVLAALMTIIMPIVAIAAVRRGAMTVGFLWVPMSSIVVFPALVGAALILRRRPEAHKRLMLIATAELLTVAVGRFPVIRNWVRSGIMVRPTYF